MVIVERYYDHDQIVVRYQLKTWIPVTHISSFKLFLPTMNCKYTLLLLLQSIIATTIALPVPGESNNEQSLGQHLGAASLWILGGIATIGMAIGGMTYGANWWNRFQQMQAEYNADIADWKADQRRKEKEHQKNMEALDIVLEVTRNFTDNIGKEPAGFNPFDIPDALEEEIQKGTPVKQPDAATSTATS